VIDAEQVLELIPEQRWFGGKDRALADARILDETVLEDGPPALVFALAEIRFDDGHSDLYHLTLLVAEDGSLTDALQQPEQLKVLGEMMVGGLSAKGSAGVWHFGGPGLDPHFPPGASSIRTTGAEQSNTSVVLDEKVILKLFRRVEPGANPDLELNRLLTSEGFEQIPPHVGDIVYEGEIDETEVTIDLGIAQTFVTDATEGWTVVMEHLRSFYGEVHPHDADEDVRFLTEERAASVMESLEELGDTTAALHVAVSKEEMAPELAPETVEEADLAAWADRTSSALRALMKSEYGLGRYEDSIEQAIERMRSVTDAGQKIRVHGDYHLGQVLLSGRGWLIIDLEGEPARSLEERLAKQSPLRDVAGMLRSFSYAVSAALFERAQPDSDEWFRLRPWADAWEALARERFLNGYLKKSHEGRFLPSDRAPLADLLDAFEIDKAFYELNYERSHRPDWVRIPMRGIAQVAERGENR
jgi:trehalose synthase-fused probable maltokinase